VSSMRILQGIVAGDIDRIFAHLQTRILLVLMSLAHLFWATFARKTGVTV
jgi:hypothetical protein